MDLITRRVIVQLEGENPSEEILAEYADSKTEKHEEMVERIRQILHFDSLKYHELEDTLDSVGLEKCNLCTYCWDGKE